MPTRRRKLIDATDEEFKDSLFFKTYMALINSPELKQMARRKHLHISFVLHPAMQNMRHYLVLISLKLLIKRITMFKNYSVAIRS
ncbi:Uncharacterised protein [Weissella viridescens]|uniref:Uncharacterized protein n=1 Tax=Weissella viridescens TaxID=1629 RepID=A0A380NZW2_WEIVI|nr:Uncharacterised protein [Weissella viridescens]